MKTHTTLSNQLYSLLVVIVLSMGFASCVTSEDDEPVVAVVDDISVTSAQVTFTYTVPKEIFRYAEITVCYKNNDGTEVKIAPMYDNKFIVTYDLNKFPATVPVAIVYDTTNRSAFGVNVDWDITMETEVTMNIDGKKVTKNNLDTYTINGDLGDGIRNLQTHVLDRTFSVKIYKTGNVQFAH